MTVFDLCPEFIFSRTSRRPSVRTEGFVQSRQTDDVHRREWVLQWTDASRDIVDRIDTIYGDTYGGVLPMDYYPPESPSAAVQVRFGPDPLEIDYTGHRKASIEVTLIEAL